MSSIGIDFGNDACVIGLAGRGGIDIILNENSNRRNPTMASFQGQQRYMGEGALSISRSNYKNTVSNMKRLIGRKWEEPDLQKDLETLSFDTERHPETGGVGIRVQYNDQDTLLMPEQVVAMMLTKVMDIAKAANSGLAVVEAVVSIPGWYTDGMRRSMLDACQIAGLNCLRLMHDSTAAALAYGIYKSAKGQFDEKKPCHVLVVDIGHSGFSASVCEFVQGALAVKSACYDRNLGGRDMDYVIAQHLADDFKAKTKLDARASKKSMLKLLDAAEKAKKTLSPVGVVDALINLECLVEERDYTGRLSLDDFERLITPLVARMTAPIEQAMKEAGVTHADLDSVEIVGGGTRVPLVKRHLATLLKTDQSAVNFGLSCTMNADEAVARGCALQCAILSSKFKVKDFSIIEAVPYPIRVSWESDAGAAAAVAEKGDDEEVPTSGNSEILFKRNDPSPKTRRIVLRRSEPFTVKVTYDDAGNLPPGVTTEIASFKVDVPESAKSKTPPPSVRVNFRHDLHGIISVQTAQLMEEIVDAAPAADAAAPPADSMDVEGKEGESKGDSKEEAAAAAPAAAPAASAEPAKKKFRAVALPVEGATASWTQAAVNSAVELEASMAHQDRVVKETSDKRNELETYIYATRDRISGGGDLAPFASSGEAAALTDKLSAAEDWLYSDEGFDSVKSVYATKLDELKQLGTKLVDRLYESQNREGAASDLKAGIDLYKRFANSRDEATAHVSDEDKDTVRAQAVKAEEWLYDRQAKQGAAPLSQDPVFKVVDIRDQLAELHKVCRPIMSQPKPVKPKEEEAKAAEEAPGAAAKTDGEAPAATATSEDTSSATPMDAEDATAGSSEGKQQDEQPAAAATTDDDMDVTTDTK